MCATCGCGDHRLHDHDPHDHDHHRRIRLEADVLAKNDGYARANRERLRALGISALNVVSGPGAGKTTLLSRTLADLRATMSALVVVGDPHTRHDADRFAAAGIRATQINTGRGCHLDAHAVGHALGDAAAGLDLVIIENVGNLVCPADFDLGEARRVALLSVTEGDDKPIKYANLFARADLMLVTKIDLLPHVDFDVERCVRFARQCNPQLEVIALSARSGEGLDGWYQWLARERAAARADSRRAQGGE